jgi:WD40 repeat protein
VLALVEGARSESSNDFLSAWNHQATSALTAPAAPLLMIPACGFEALRVAWSRLVPPARLQQKGSAIGMQDFVKILSPVLQRADLFDADGLATGAHSAALVTKAQRRNESMRFHEKYDAQFREGDDESESGTFVEERVDSFSIAPLRPGASSSIFIAPSLGRVGRALGSFADIARVASFTSPLFLDGDSAKVDVAAGDPLEALIATLSVPVREYLSAIDEFRLDYARQNSFAPSPSSPSRRKPYGVALNAPVVNFACDVFEMVDTRREGTITWEGFITFVIDRVYSHDTTAGPDAAGSGGGSRARKDVGDEGDDTALRINPVTGTRLALKYMGQVELAEPEEQHWLHKLHHFPQWDAVVALSHNTAAVYLTEDIDEYILDSEQHAMSGDVVRRQHGGSLQERRKAARRQRATQSVKRSAVEASGKGWAKSTYDEQAEESCKATYLHAPASVHCCEYLSAINCFATVSNSVTDQIGLHSVHLRKEVKFTRRIHAPTRDGSHISVVKEYQHWHRRRGFDAAVLSQLSKAQAQQAATRKANEDPDDEPPAIDLNAVINAAVQDRTALLLGLRNGGVQLMELAADATRKASRTAALAELAYTQVHTEEVTDCLVVPRTGRVLTGSLDATVAVHTPDGGVCSRYIGHEKGVTTVAYCDAFELFLSGGFEYHALSWAENLPNSPAFALIDSTNPHVQPLCRIIAVEGTPQVYTMDVSGVVKLFDIRSLKAIETWRAFDPGRVPVEVAQDVKSSGSRDTFHLGDVGSACYTGARHRSILIGAKNAYCFHTEARSADAQRTHDMRAPMVGLHVGCRLFLSATQDAVRAWATRDGTEVRTQPMSRYTSSPVSVMTADDSSARVYTGHNDGSINCFHAESAVLLRRYIKHEARVRAIAIDVISHTLISTSSRGDVIVWDLADRESSPVGPLGHLDHLTGSLTPMPSRAYRLLEDAPPNLRDLLQPGTPALPRARILARWVACRWRALVARRRGGNPRLAVNAAGRAAASLVVSRTRGTVFLRHPGITVIPDSKRMRCMVLSSKANARIIDYSEQRVATKTRMFHGTETELTSCAFWPDRNLAVVADTNGGMWAWLVPDQLEHPILLGKWLNRCQVSANAHPLSAFLRDDEVDDMDVAIAAGDHVDFEVEVNASDEAVMLQAAQYQHRDSTLPPDAGGTVPDGADVLSRRGSTSTSSRRPTLSFHALVKPLLRLRNRVAGDTDVGRFGHIVPAITAMYLDPVRACLITGDDVGYITIWEVDTLFGGHKADHSTALVPSAATGCDVRFTHSWRGHDHPVTKVDVYPHTTYAVVSAATDNVAAIWWPDGTWAAGLRQGPIVNRQFSVPSAKQSRRSWAVLAFRKVLNAYREGFLDGVMRRSRGAVPPSIYTRAFRSMILEGSNSVRDLRTATSNIRTKLQVINALVDAKHEADDLRARPGSQQLRDRFNRRRAEPSAGTPTTASTTTSAPARRALDPRIDPRANSRPLRFENAVGDLVGGSADARRVMMPQHDGLCEARTLFDAATYEARATSGVVQALKKAHEATGTVNPDNVLHEGAVITDPLVHAQRDAGKYRSHTYELSDQVLRSQEAVADIAKVQRKLAQQHLRSQAALSSLPPELAPHVGIFCGTVSLGGSSGNDEITVRFPALRPGRVSEPVVRSRSTPPTAGTVCHSFRGEAFVPDVSRGDTDHASTSSLVDRAPHEIKTPTRASTPAAGLERSGSAVLTFLASATPPPRMSTVRAATLSDVARQRVDLSRPLKPERQSSAVASRPVGVPAPETTYTSAVQVVPVGPRPAVVTDPRQLSSSHGRRAVTPAGGKSVASHSSGGSRRLADLLPSSGALAQATGAQRPPSRTAPLLPAATREPPGTLSGLRGFNHPQ